MPRITPCRGLKFILFVYAVVLSLWATLPSPSISPIEREKLIQNTLASGSLMTVHAWSDYNSNFEVALPDGMALLMRWDFEQRTEEQSRIGDAYVMMFMGGAHYKVKDAIDAARDFNAHPDFNDSSWVPYFGDYLGPGFAPLGYTNSFVNLPWFHPADKAFFGNQEHNIWGFLFPRFIVPEPGVLQVWNDGVVNATLGNEAFEKLRKYNCEPMSEYNGVRVVPGCSEIGERRELYKDTWARLQRLEGAEREAGLLATFKQSEWKDLNDVVVEELRGEIPSKTYPIRKALFVVLTPVFAIYMFLRYGVYDAFAPVVEMAVSTGLTMIILYAAIVAACWVAAGLPNFAEWSAEFWLTKSFRRRATEDVIERNEAEERVYERKVGV